MYKVYKKTRLQIILILLAFLVISAIIIGERYWAEEEAPRIILSGTLFDAQTKQVLSGVSITALPLSKTEETKPAILSAR